MATTTLRRAALHRYLKMDSKTYRHQQFRQYVRPAARIHGVCECCCLTISAAKCALLVFLVTLGISSQFAVAGPSTGSSAADLARVAGTPTDPVNVGAPVREGLATRLREGGLSAPTINAASGIGRTEGEGDPFQEIAIAQVFDAQDAPETLTLKVNGLDQATVNLVAVEIRGVNLAGQVRAFVWADCGATSASFTLRVTDSDLMFNEAVLAVQVTANSPPVLAYQPVTVFLGSGGNVLPSLGPDDGGNLQPPVLQAIGTYQGFAAVAQNGMVMLGSASPAGIHTLVIRATDNCGAITDAPLQVRVADVFSDGFE